MSAGSQNSSQQVSLNELAEKRIVVYETETCVCKTYKMKSLRNSNSPTTMLKIPVQKWKMHADVILPGDEKSGKGPIQIASVPISLSMAVRRSVFGQDENIYVTERI